MAKAKTTRKTEDQILQEAMERVQNETGDDGAAEPPAVRPGKTKTVPAVELPRSKKVAMVAYIPLDPEDAAFTIFFGMKFTANVPRETSNPELIALARQNPWFSVDGKPGPKRAAPVKRDDADDLSARAGIPASMASMKEVEIGDSDGEDEV